MKTISGKITDLYTGYKSIGLPIWGLEDGKLSLDKSRQSILIGILGERSKYTKFLKDMAKSMQASPNKSTFEYTA
jgi:hypothetical protein